MRGQHVALLASAALGPCPLDAPDASLLLSINKRKSVGKIQRRGEEREGGDLQRTMSEEPHGL